LMANESKNDRKDQAAPVVLCILDGWGYSADIRGNAIAQARTPNYDDMWDAGPRSLLATSGQDVGLPAGQMGNSEVGHMNLGSGRVILQDLPRIDEAIKNGDLAANAALGKHIEALKASGGTCHLMGLLSPGGVHSHQNHMVALAGIINRAGVPVLVHAFLDGRDTPPQSAGEYIARFETDISTLPATKIATLCGRYYAMDRDQRWDRVEKAYKVIVKGAADSAVAQSAAEAIKAAYKAAESDEFILPLSVGDYRGISDGDGLLMANFRADRARQLLASLLDPDFTQFARAPAISFATALGMIEYSTKHNAYMDVIFPPIEVKDTLGAVVAGCGLMQLRIAETEKYAHVTFFFNGGQETPFAGEERILVPSPRVATYDLKPEMSANELTDNLVSAIATGGFDLVIVNYANPDMVGHTGIMEAAIKAVEAVDGCLGMIKNAVTAAGGILLVTADHGNVEMMLDPTGSGPHTAHTTTDVPLLIFNAGTGIGLRNGCLADVAPSILKLMKLDQPGAMTGRSLITGGDAN
jgi:2,3-bisphosphoglycerate-independent phosphoglycerate mutase